MVVIRNAGFPGIRTPRSAPLPKAGPVRLIDEIEEFLTITHMSRSAFASAVGQSSNPKNGLFIKAREGRLHADTISRVRRYMQSYSA